MSETKTFPVEVEGVGRFSFRHRTMRDEMRIGAEYSRLTEGVDTPSHYLDTLAGMTATIKVLCDEAPAGWDIDSMDPLDAASYERMIAVYTALREKEQFFRQGPGPASQGTREDTGRLG